MGWREIFTYLAWRADTKFSELKHRMHFALGRVDPIKIVPYRGYGTRERLYLKGRVLEEKEIGPAEETDRFWNNLLNTWRRLNSDEIPYARLRARIGKLETTLQADNDGMFEIDLRLPEPLDSPEVWQQIELEYLGMPAPLQDGPVRAVAEVLVPPDSARYIVVSDIDDTVIKTDMANLLKVARKVFLGNARTRSPFPGVAAFYRALHAGGSGSDANPLLFVSGSPWNLYDLLSHFFELQEIPRPVLFLRPWGIVEDEILPTRQREHKLAVIRRMMETYDDLPFLLLGDSGQEDPEIYAELVTDFPERVLSVYIRNVSRKPERIEAIRELADKVAEAGIDLVLTDSTVAMARHAVAKGYIRPDALHGIEGEKARDEEPSELEEMFGGGPKTEGRTHVVHPDEDGLSDGGTGEDELEEALEDQAPGEEAPTIIVEGNDVPDREPSADPGTGGRKSDREEREEEGR